MIKKLSRNIVLSIAAIAAFFLTACSDNSSNGESVTSPGDAYVNSSDTTYSSACDFISSSAIENGTVESSGAESSAELATSSSGENSSSSEPPAASSSSVESGSVESGNVESSAELASSSATESSSSAEPPVSSSSKSLNGIVWYVIGDSFSAGDFEGIDPTPTIKEGTYAGKLPVYSYLIGNRTGCDVRNISAGGTTLCYYDTYGFTKPETGMLYTTDFSDADIITIYYGINDSHNAIAIGDIDDMNPRTFYGAFNVALDYLTKNYPQAKIGIIVSNGCDTEEYPEATEQIALKWKLPYLDLDGGVNGITMIRSSSRNPASSEEKKRVLKEQWVSESNWHPNEYAHELESHFIEEWLLTLL